MPTITIEADGAATGTTADLQASIVQAAPGDEGPPPPESAEDTIIPVVLLLAIALTYCVKYFFAYRTRRDAQQTVRLALERGEALTPQLLEHLGQAPKPRRNDLRRGVIAVGLGAGIGAFGLVIGEPDAVRPMLAVGLVPLLVGLAYLALWRLGGDRD